MAHITTLTRAYDDLYNSQANTYSYSGSFETFKESEVKVKLNDTLLTYNSSPSDNTQYSVNLTDKTIHVGGGNLSSGTLSIYPATDLGAPTLKAPYTAGSAVTASDLTNNQKQVLRKLMEHEETKLNNTGGTMTGDLTIGEDQTIIFEGATDDGYETTLTVADPTADRTITLPNISGNVVTTGDTGTVTSTMLTDGTIVNADVNASAAIAGTKISPNFGSQTISTSGNATVGGTLGVTGAVDLNGGASIDNIQIGVTGDNEIDTASGNLTIDSAGGTTTVDDALTVSGAATLQSTLGVTGTSTLADVTGGAVVTSGTSTSDTKVYSAKRAGEIFYGKDTVEEIQSGETWSAADDKVATTAAIDARIIDLVDDVGGFVPIANELSFPNANPDVNNGAGTLVSIKALSTAYTSNSSGEITISNGTVGNSTVTITGAGNTVTYAQTLGMIVETTSTLNTYAFHRQTPDATTTTAVANNATNINKVAAIDSDVTAVANIDSNVTAVAGNATNINAVAGNATNINAVAADASDIGIVAADGTDIGLVAGSISNVNNVGGSIASVNTAAANINSIANFGDQYQVASSNPSTDGGGNDLAEGDLYFNTTANELKVYNGSQWQGGVTASGNFAAVTGNTFTGDNVYQDNAKLKLGTGSDLEIFHNANDSIINDAGTGDLKIQSGGNTKLEVTSAGVGVTGNIAVSGTVDGRDVATDGTKLDGIEASATADQTAAEIRTLVESASDSNVFTDADHTKLNGIEASATADQTDAEIRAAVEAASDSNVFTDADHTKLNGIAASANNYVHPNHSGEVTSTADGATVIADDVVDEANLKISNAGSDGQFLSKQSGNTGGLTWATVTTDLVGDTSPQLGGDLDTNGSNIVIDGDDLISLSSYAEISRKTAATNANGGYVQQNSLILDGLSDDIWLTNSGKKVTIGTSDSTTYEVARFQNAAVGAGQHGYVDLNYVVANVGGNASSANRLKTTETGMTFTGVIVPAADSTHDLGTTSVRWRNIYADTLYGDGSNLTGISTSPTADTGGAIFENSQTISANHTIPVGSNGMSAGPVTVNNNITLTISNGSTYTIV